MKRLFLILILPFLIVGCSKSTNEITSLPDVNLGAFWDMDGSNVYIPFEPNCSMPLLIKNVKTECSCFSGSLDKIQISAKGAAVLRIYVKPRFLNSDQDFSKLLIVSSDRGFYAMKVKWISKAAVHIDHNIIDFGKCGLTASSVPQQVLPIVAFRPNSLNNIVVEGTRVHALFKPITEGARSSIVAELDPSFYTQLMPIDEWTYITSKEWPSGYQIPIRVELNVERRSQFSPQEINLGIISDEDSFRKEITVENPFIGDKFKISNAPQEVSDILVREIGTGKYNITISGKVSTAAGHEFSKILRFATNDPLEPLTYIKVFGVVPQATCCHTAE